MLILYTSDFHFSSDNSAFDIASKKLNALAKSINDNGYNIDIFVFTGDAIDAKSITVDAIKKMYETSNPDRCKKLINCLENNQSISNYFSLIDEKKEFDRIVAQKTDELVGKAAKVIKNFLNAINVTDPKKIIICCGNHDVLRTDAPLKFTCQNGADSDKLNPQNFDDNYQYFYQFGEVLLSTKLKNSPEIYRVDDYAFLVIDSNITNEHGKACIQCDEVSKKLNELKSENKLKNIAISHKPFFDYCENAIIKYENSEKPVTELIKEKCSFVLFGDKHGQYRGKFLGVEEMLLGSPLIDNEIHYCILKTDEIDGHIKEYRDVCGKNNSWSFSVFNIDIVLDYCKMYFSSVARNFIGEINMTNILNMNFDIIEKLFKKTTRKRWEKDYKNDYIQSKCFSFKETYDYLVNIYKNENTVEKSQNLFNFRGRPSTGKTLLSCSLFCYLLKEFYLCKTNFIPMYFNLNPILKGCTENYDEYLKKAKQKFEEYIEKCNEVMRIFDSNVLCIIDGLEEKNCYNSCVDEKNIENYIIDSLNDNCKFKYILAFDKTIVPLAMENLPQYKLKCDFIYYLKRLDIVDLNKRDENIKTGSNSILDTFDAYFQICPYLVEEKKRTSSQPDNDIYSQDMKDSSRNLTEDVLDALLKLHLTNINYMFLKNNISHLVNANFPKHDKEFFHDFIDILETRHAKIYSDGKALDTYDLYPVAYNYYMNGLTYSELKEKYPINFQAFRKIKNDEELLQYLTAIYYVNTMQKMSNGLIEDIDTSIFSCFIPRNISLMMRWHIERYNKIKMVGNFINYLINNNKKIPHQLKSVLFYLAGFLKQDYLLPLVKNLKVDNSRDGLLSDEMISFNEYCVVRSEQIARIVCCKDETKRNIYKEEFIGRLFDDETFREMNRVFQSVYYGDNTLHGYNGRPFCPTKDIIYKGMDFYYTFLTLIAKYDLSYKKGNDFNDYSLIDIDMFTLCDIVYHRLQNFKTCNSYNSLYYNPKYKDKAIATLKRLEEALNNVVNSSATRYNRRLNNYFKAMKNIFGETANNIDSKSDAINLDKPYGSPQKLLNDFLDSSVLLSQEKNESYSTCFRAVYIALFFLPDNQSVKQKYGDIYCDYDKNLIVSILLLSNAKDDIISNILSMGAPCGFGNLTQYFNCISVDKSDSFNINLIIAKDIYIIAQNVVRYSADEFRNLSRICEPICKILNLENDKSS